MQLTTASPGGVITQHTLSCLTKNLWDHLNTFSDFSTPLKCKSKALAKSALHSVITPYNVGSVLRRLFITVGDSISTAEAVQYCGGIALVLRGDSISTAEE